VRHRLAAGRGADARRRRHPRVGQSGLIVIDCSTSNPVSTLALHAEAQVAGMHFVDAPLSRTPVEAEPARWTPWSAPSPSLRAHRAGAALLGRPRGAPGPVGLGHKMKLINNFVAMGYAALFAEGLAIARKAGLSVEQFHSVVGSGRMRSPFYDTFMKWSLEGDENAHRFSISNAHKDMRYLASMAGEVGAVNPIQAA
jgi:3-hydroxyisobutyrate dehydrogenase-like beta-hydroxyacid dehydrogenase